MTLKLSPSINDSLTTLMRWLTASEETMRGIENELQPTKLQSHLVGMEWAGTLSRLD